MSQVKIYGVDERLIPIREQLSEVIHGCVMKVLGLPADKRAHRFFPMSKDNFLMPGGRSDAYTILEISMIEGRSEATRKQLVRELFDTIEDRLEIAAMDLEICIYESPAANWGFRGMHGDEVALSYAIDV